MPASLTRKCPRCNEERSTPDEFRDANDTVGPGRPPSVCRFCRAADPALQRRQRENVRRRPGKRKHHDALAARSFAEIEADLRYYHPEGTKTCSAVAGCGRTLPFSAFTANRRLYDGLEAICHSCRIEHADLRRERYDMRRSA